MVCEEPIRVCCPLIFCFDLFTIFINIAFWHFWARDAWIWTDLFHYDAKIYLTSSLNFIVEPSYYYQRLKFRRGRETVSFGVWLIWWKQICKYFELDIPLCFPFSYWEIRQLNDCETQTKSFILSNIVLCIYIYNSSIFSKTSFDHHFIWILRDCVCWFWIKHTFTEPSLIKHLSTNIQVPYWTPGFPSF